MHRWIAVRENCRFPVSALSQIFRGKFLALLQQACDKGKIPPANNEIKASPQKSWVVYAKKPFGSPQTVLDYLGRYTHRVALANDRILQVENGEVTLSYRDRDSRLAGLARACLALAKTRSEVAWQCPHHGKTIAADRNRRPLNVVSLY